MSVALDKLTAIQPQILELIPEQIAGQERNKTLLERNYATQSGLLQQSAESLANANAMGQGLRGRPGRQLFYLPPEVFDNAEFKRGFVDVPLG